MAKRYIVMKLQKVSNFFYRKRVPLLPRFFFVINRLLCGCSIPPSVEIGRNTRLAHNGLGVIIHEKAVIGNDTIIQGNVVIGGKDGKAPIIGDRCYIGAGAVILGNVRISDDSIVGANAVVTHDVPSGMIALGVPARCMNKTS